MIPQNHINPLRRRKLATGVLSDFSGACNAAVRPCNSQYMGDLVAINSLPPGSERESKVNALTAKMAKCLGSHGWPCKQVSKDSVKFDSTGDTMDLIANSGSGVAVFQCLLTAGPNFQPPESSGNNGNYNLATPSGYATDWVSSNWMYLLGGAAVLILGFMLLRRH